jgi:predicted small secreted protein
MNAQFMKKMLVISIFALSTFSFTSVPNGGIGVGAEVRKATIVDNDLPGSPIIDCSTPGKDCKVHF